MKTRGLTHRSDFRAFAGMTRVAVGILSTVLILDALAIVVTVVSADAGSCPSFCVCDTWYDLQRASCIGRHLYSIHTGAPSGVQALDVSNNSISALNDYELSTAAGLSKLKYLNLSTNTISEIGLNAFDGLSELTVLDLSQNHLYSLLSDAFIPTKSLRVLRLSGNNFNSHVPKLKCPWLTDLALDSCQISHVPADMFVGLLELRTLDLSNNVMIQLDSVTFESLHFLRKLSIEGNPWSCNKLTYDLQLYLIRKNIKYHAICTKISEPKKFEKMVIYNPKMKYQKHQSSIISSTDVRKNAIMTRKNLASTPMPENATACVNAKEGDFTKTLNAISPYWFFTLGFLAGSGCSMFMCYVWLTKKIFCRFRGRRGNDIQRISLLQNPWQFEDPVLNDDAQTISCPGTPPPPYRDVMLRPALYRNPSILVNLNNNTTTSSTGHTT